MTFWGQAGRGRKRQPDPPWPKIKRPNVEAYERPPKRSRTRNTRQERRDSHLQEAYRSLLNEVLKAEHLHNICPISTHLKEWISQQIHDLERI